MKKAFLHLTNSLEFQGYSFGYEAVTSGETVFSTMMVGYPETLTDPSYSGQLLCITYPLIGNYGVAKDFESDHIWTKGLVITDCSFNYSHWSALKSLDEWLKENKIPGIFGIDTRQLTKVLRDNGSMAGCIAPEGASVPSSFYSPDSENQVALVSCKEIIRYNEGKNFKKIVIVDCGLKNSILNCFTSRNLEVIRVPWNFDFTSLEYDGLVISNGPGNPDFCGETVTNINKAMAAGKPIFGIGLGHQLMAKAVGFPIVKLPYGHRGYSQPVRLIGSNKCFITTQNHGYAVDASDFGGEWIPTFTNMNDGTNEGLRHKNGRFFSIQFHPEMTNGHSDFDFLFDEFTNIL